MKTQQTFAARLASLRRRAGMTQTMLAAVAGVTQPLVSQLEAGKCQPGWDTVQALAGALGVGVEEFERTANGDRR